MLREGKENMEMAQGHSEDETVADPSYPRYRAKFAEQWHEVNIRVMYTQLAGN